jgi:two-component system, sensor histidine kinase ChiS
LLNDWIKAISFDKQGNVWIGTNGGGLVMFDGVNWTIYTKSNSELLDDYIQALFIDGYNNKWIGAVEAFMIFNESGIIISP